MGTHTARQTELQMYPTKFSELMVVKKLPFRAPPRPKLINFLFYISRQETKLELTAWFEVNHTSVFQMLWVIWPPSISLGSNLFGKITGGTEKKQNIPDTDGKD